MQEFIYVSRIIISVIQQEIWKGGRKLKKFIFGSLMLVLLGLTVVGCGGSTKPLDTDKDAVKWILNSYNQYIIQQNIPELLKLYAAKYTWISDNKETILYNTNNNSTNTLKKDLENYFAKYKIIIQNTRVDICKKNGDFLEVSAVTDKQFKKIGDATDNTYKIIDDYKITFLKSEQTWLIHICELVSHSEEEIVK